MDGCDSRKAAEMISGPAETPGRTAVRAAVIVALAVAVYLPAMGGGFFWDDESILLRNPLVQGPGGLHDIWFSTRSPDYQPLVRTALWVEWRVWGEAAAGYHVVNALLHAACAALLWRALLRLKTPGAWLAGLLFAAHPVAAASAAWIAELKNTLSLALCLLSFIAYLDYDESGGRRRYVLSLLLFLAALLAKASVVMMPAALLLCAWRRRGDVTRADTARTAPFFALSLLLGLVTIWFQAHNAIGSEVVRPEGWASRLAAAGWIPWFYAYKLLWPAGLCVIYPRWDVDGADPLSFVPLLALAGALALLWIRRAAWGRGPFLAAAGFVVMLLPVMGFVDMSFMKHSLVADHLQYPAMAALLALAAAGLARWMALPGWGGQAGRAAACAAVTALACLTWQRAGLYGDALRMWRDNLARNPASATVWNNLGERHAQAGDWRAAVGFYDGAISRDARNVAALNNRGNALVNLGDIPGALRDYDRAIALRPDYADALANRAAARTAAGRTAEALGDSERAVALNPDGVSAWGNRGAALAASGRCEEAVAAYDRAVALVPGDAEARYNRAGALARLGRSEAALADYDLVIASAPGHADAFNNRGALHAAAGRLDPALRDYARAIALRPGFAAAYNNRGNVLSDAQRPAEALRDYDQAVALKPDFAEAWFNRAGALIRLDRLAEALRDYDRAIALKPDFVAAYANRAALYCAARDYDRAFADVRMVRKLGGQPRPGLLKALAEGSGRREE
jgi:tetratricopeptide (TPR) repeat protein